MWNLNLQSRPPSFWGMRFPAERVAPAPRRSRCSCAGTTSGYLRPARSPRAAQGCRQSDCSSSDEAACTPTNSAESGTCPAKSCSLYLGEGGTLETGQVSGKPTRSASHPTANSRCSGCSPFPQCMLWLPHLPCPSKRSLPKRQKCVLFLCPLRRLKQQFRRQIPLRKN